MKPDKSLKEIWDWKDNVYRETKHLSVREAAKKIHEDVQQIKKKYGLYLKTLHPVHA
jgi:shikimate kinase